MSTVVAAMACGGQVEKRQVLSGRRLHGQRNSPRRYRFHQLPIQCQTRRMLRNRCIGLSL